MSGASFLDHTDPLFSSNKILKIHDLYKLNIALYMYERSDNDAFQRDHHYDTRNRNELRPHRPRLTATENSLKVIGPIIWNSIPGNIQNSLTRSSFKYQYKNNLLAAYNVQM